MREGPNIYHEFSDNDLVKLISKGDSAAFTELHIRYRGILYLHAYKLSHDTQDAEDIVQDIFVSLWERSATLKFSKGIKSYLYSAVRYKFFDLLDHRQVISKHEASFNLFASKGEFITDNQIREKELYRLVEQEVAKLPEKMRVVFELSRKQHLSPEEISRQLKISDKTVKRQLANAVKILRPKFGDLFTVLFTGLF